MKWFSSDWHLNHANSIKFSKRPFLDVRHMDKTIMHNMLSTMKRGDNLYFLGDMAFSADVSERALIELGDAGIHVHWIKGNHDEDRMPKRVESLCTSVSHIKTLYIGEDKQKVVLCHYPLVVWESSFRGSWLLHGHVHIGSIDRPFVEQTCTGKVLNVNLEMHDYKPWSEEEVITYMATRPTNFDQVLVMKERESREVQS